MALENATMTPEGKVLNAIVRRFRQIAICRKDFLWIKLHGSAWQLAGLPDLLCLLAGRAIFLEVKSDKGITSALQVEMMRRIRRAGATAQVVRSVEEAERALGIKE